MEDKNGKEICEGDFVKCGIMEHEMLCSFWYGKFVLVHRPTCRSEIEGKCAYDDLGDFKGTDLEVIGNMKTMPELLQAI